MKSRKSGRGSRVARFARRSADMLSRGVPVAAHAAQDGMVATTNALQALPDPTLRWLAASSVGLGAGLYLAGAPRLARAAGFASAMIMGAAIAMRPAERVPQRAAR